MSQLLGHIHALRALADAYRRTANEDCLAPHQAGIKAELLMHALVHERAATILIDQARAETSGEDRRGEAPLGRKVKAR